jgi:hypothetical protein
MLRLVPFCAAVFAALVAWLSQGTVGFDGPAGTRLALLPVSMTAALLPAVAAAAVLLCRWAGGSLLPVALLGLLALPWLPFRVPAAFLIWVAPVAWIVWLAVVVLLAASIPGSPTIAIRRPRLTAAIIALAIFGLSAWRAAPMIPGGDEPHYLVITQSLLLDGDLTIEDVHRRGDYRAYYAGELPPHVQRRGLDGRIYSVHAPGLPALLAPAFAIGGHPAVVVFLVLLAAAGTALAWHVGWLATGQTGAAWFAWTAVTLPVTAIFQSFTVYPDGVGGVLALTGLWAVLRAGDESRSGSTRVLPWFLHGMALALLPWLHSRFAVLAGGFGALILLRLGATKDPASKAVAFLSVPAISAVLWIGFFLAIYGRADPTAPYGPGEIGSFQFVPGGLGGLLFDQRFGLLAYAPVLAIAFGGLAVMTARAASRRFALELLFVILPYLLTVTHFAMWWGGWSAPARFFAPVLPLFCLPAAHAWVTFRGRTARAVIGASVVLTAAASAIVIWVDRGRLAYNTRETTGLWLDWMGRLADLTTAAPLWARDTDVPLFRAIAVWLATAAVMMVAVRRAERAGRLDRPSALRTAMAAALAVTIMAASTVVWSFDGATGRRTAESQLRLLDAIGESARVVALQVDGWSRLRPSDLAGRMRMELVRSPGRRGTGRGAAVMFAVPPLPAGEYRLSVAADPARGWVMVGLARDQFAIRTQQLPVDPFALRFLSPVRGLVIGGDEDARSVVRGLRIEPLRVFGPAERLTGETARRAVRYGDGTVFFLDERSFPEPEAFWVGGGRTSTVLYQPDRARTSIPLHLRNGPVFNTVDLSAGGWHETLTLAPGEERRVSVPLDPSKGGGVIRIGSSAGFQPSAIDPSSRDHRFLGVWVDVRETH